MPPYSAYVLRSVPLLRRTYAGISNRLRTHRIRQHNGILTRGGARYTRIGRPYVILIEITGFRSHSEALQFEDRIKVHPKRKKVDSSWKSYLNHRTLGGHKWLPVVARIVTACRSTRWTERSPLASDVPLTINWSASQLDWLPETWPELPAHVQIQVV